MSPAMRNGFCVAALHVALVASLGAKLLGDRATRPRVWARAAPADPNLPIRGRYVQLRIEAAAGRGLDFEAFPLPSGRPGINPISGSVNLSVRDGQLVAVPAAGASGLRARLSQRASGPVAVLDQPIAYFIPEHAADPSRRPLGEELWVEVTLPSRGAPRPIRLGVKKDGVLTPLELN
jgi:hypothetical protein